MSKILVAYFSRAGENYFGGAIKSVAVGNTEICADLIKQAFPDADLFKIEMAAPYADNYRKCVSQVTADMMLHKRPALTALPESIAAYDAIVLGYPNYCGTIPMAVATFLEAFDFTGKKLLPYCTNEGSGMGRSEKDLRKLCPTAVIAPGLAITGSAAAQSKPRWSGGCRKICNSPAGRRGRRKKPGHRLHRLCPGFICFSGDRFLLRWCPAPSGRWRSGPQCAA